MYKMFGTRSTNEEGHPADPCDGDSGVFLFEDEVDSSFRRMKRKLVWKFYWILISKLMENQLNFPGGPLVWQSPASRFVLIGTLRGGGFNCK